MSYRAAGLLLVAFAVPALGQPQLAAEATVVSGRLDGTYHYRIRTGSGPWSDPITVEVRHHSLAQAFAFLSVGAVVFLATTVKVSCARRR